ncbi:MAG: TetR/AcrR family transcriptional regulator [Candidatus Neomarinimicrobiota bacterium]|nr:MAG: TetR/AcrR family transcriptional regulator [Candidatus Neomarinimicrobiota bacterium]
MQTERQTQILNSSMELIANKGIQGFTIKNLSEKIGITEPAIYRHFGSKTDILNTILNNFKKIIGIIFLMLESFEGTAIDKISFMFSQLLKIFDEQATIISVIFSEEIFKNELSLNNNIRDIQDILQLNLENILETGQANRNIRRDIDKRILALMLMGSFRLLMKRWDSTEYNFNLKLEGEKLINSFKLIIVNN